MDIDFFRKLADLRAPRSYVGGTVYISTNSGDKPCIVTAIEIGKVRIGRQVGYRWFYHLRTESGTGIVRTDQLVSFDNCLRPA